MEPCGWSLCPSSFLITVPEKQEELDVFTLGRQSLAATQMPQCLWDKGEAQLLLLHGWQLRDHYLYYLSVSRKEDSSHKFLPTLWNYHRHLNETNNGLWKSPLSLTPWHSHSRHKDLGYQPNSDPRREIFFPPPVLEAHMAQSFIVTRTAPLGEVRQRQADAAPAVLALCLSQGFSSVCVRTQQVYEQGPKASLTPPSTSGEDSTW